MMLYYLDSSAWAKRYFQETGSEAVDLLAEQLPVLACSPLSLIEVGSTTARKRNAGVCRAGDRPTLAEPLMPLSWTSASLEPERVYRGVTSLRLAHPIDLSGIPIAAHLREPGVKLDGILFKKPTLALIGPTFLRDGVANNPALR
jgi:hypothetical protein